MQKMQKIKPAIRQALKDHAAWLTLRREKPVDFSEIDMRNTDLTGASLRSACLYNVDLTGSKLVNADLRGAELVGSRLVGVDMTGAKLDGAVFDGAVLSLKLLKHIELSTGIKYSCFPRDEWFVVLGHYRE